MSTHSMQLRSLLVLVLMVGTSARVQAQAPPPERPPTPIDAAAPRRVAAAAQELLAAGRFAEAAAHFEAGLAQCPPLPAGAACGTLLAYGRGYVEQAWADADAAAGTAHLQQATAWYRRAATYDPSNGGIYAAWARATSALGEAEQTRELIEKAIEADPPQADEYRLLAGDLAAARGAREEALAAYRRAARGDLREIAWRRTLALLRDEPAISGRELLSFAQSIAAAPDLAAEALVLVVERTYRQEGAVADEALLRWVDLQAGRGLALVAADLDVFPDPGEWPSPALAGLRALLVEPRPGAGSLDWWRAEPLRRDIAARVLETRATGAESRDDLELAQRLLEQAIELAPRFYEYDAPALVGRSIAELDVALRLIPLLERRGDIHRSQSLIRELFNEKSEAYARRNLAAIHRYHTVLAMVFARRRQWTSSGADNAIFQLEHALATGRELRSKQGLPPAPELHSLLAEAYRATAAPAQRVAEQQLAAAAGYLDLDDLNAAGQALEGCVEACNVEQAAALRAITATRVRVAAGATVEVVTDATGAWQLAPSAGWIATPDTLGLAPELVARQRFKTLADAGENAGLAGQTAAANYLRAEALQAIEASPVLPSPGDVTRVRQIGSAVGGEIGVDGRDQVRIEATPLTDDGAKRWMVPTGQGGVDLVVDRDLLIGTRILGQRDLAASIAAGSVKVGVDAGNVTVSVSPEQPAATSAQEQLLEERVKSIRRVAGVKEVAVVDSKAAAAAAAAKPPG